MQQSELVNEWDYVTQKWILWTSMVLMTVNFHWFDEEKVKSTLINSFTRSMRGIGFTFYGCILVTISAAVQNLRVAHESVQKFAKQALEYTEMVLTISWSCNLCIFAGFSDYSTREFWNRRCTNTNATWMGRPGRREYLSLSGAVFKNYILIFSVDYLSCIVRLHDVSLFHVSASKIFIL